MTKIIKKEKMMSRPDPDNGNDDNIYPDTETLDPGIMVVGMQEM